MSSATTKIVFRYDKINNNHEAPINIRIIKHRKVQYIGTGWKLNEKFWDKENNRVRKSFPNSIRLNQYLNSLLVKYTDEILEEQTNDSNISVKKLKEKISGLKDAKFFDVANELLNKYLQRKEKGTHDKTQSIIKKLKTYTANENLSFEDINIRFLVKYESYLSAELNNSINTIAKDFKFIRTVINYAINQEIIPESSNPFRKYKIKIEKTERTHLTENEIQLIEYFNAKSERINRHKDIFLFQYYSGGFRISDILLLKWRHLLNGKISLKIKKTGVHISLTLKEKAINILNKYHTDVSMPSDYVFGMIPNNIDEDDFIKIDNYITSATANINRSLKSVAKECKIEKRISSHIARHSFGTNALEKGLKIEHIQKIMAHANLKETQIYAKVQDKDIDNALDLFNSSSN